MARAGTGRTGIAALILIPSLVLGASSCGQDEVSVSATGVPTTVVGSSSTTRPASASEAQPIAEAFLAAADRHDGAAVCDLLTDVSRATLDDSGCDGLADRYAGGELGHLMRIDTAQVAGIVTRPSGPKDQRLTALALERSAAGRWEVTLWESVTADSFSVCITFGAGPGLERYKDQHPGCDEDN